MLTWLSRIMIIVFMFNIFTPELAFARRNRRSERRSRMEQAVAARIENTPKKGFSSAKNRDELTEIYATLMTDLANTYDSLEFTNDMAFYNKLAETVEKMHDTTEKYAFYRDAYIKVEKESSNRVQTPYAPTYEPAIDNTYYQPHVNVGRVIDIETNITVEKFLDRVKQNQLSVVDLVEEMDPLTLEEYDDSGELKIIRDLTPSIKSNASYLVTAYAAEVILNTLNSLSKEEAKDSEVLDLLARIQARAIYRLDHLPDGLNENAIMARGTLRTLLNRISVIYNQAGRKDPAVNASELARNFLNEARAIKNEKKTKPGTTNYALLKLHLEYAVRYSVLANQSQTLTDLVELFEQDPTRPFPRDKFETDYVEVLGTIFSGVVETIKLFPIEQDALNAMTTWLVTMAKPAQDINTRVLAISASGLLNIDKSKSAFTAEAKETLSNKEKFYKMSEIQRATIVQYAVDIYASLTNSGPYGMSSYGLDSKQMQTLADDLALSIERLLPVSGLEAVWSGDRNNFTPASRTSTINNFDKNQHMDQAGKTIQKPIFLYGSDRRLWPIYYKNNPNPRKVDEENSWAAFRFVAESVLWAIGIGAIVKVARALSLVRGAVSFLPRAIRAANAAQKGKKWGRFTTQLRKGWKYGASVNSTLARGGAAVQTVRTEKTVVKAADVAANTSATTAQIGNATNAAGKTASTIRIDAPVSRTGTNYLIGGRTGQKGTQGFFRRLWNKITGNTPLVDRYIVSGHRPGFQFAEVEIDAAQFGLQNGIRTPLQRKRFYDALLQKGFNFSPLSSAELRLVAQEEQLLGTMGQALGFDATANALNAGRFDFWAYNGTQFERVTPKEFFDRAFFLKQVKAEPLPNFYKILGVEQNTTLGQVKNAYRKLSQQFHPDVYKPAIEANARVNAAEKALKEATTPVEKNFWRAELEQAEAQAQLAAQPFKDISEAYSFFTNGKIRLNGQIYSREAYNARLAQQLASPTSGPLFLKPQIPVSPEGYSLAITPKEIFPTGVTAGYVPPTQVPPTSPAQVSGLFRGPKPQGFNPIKYGGLGLNAQNISGDLGLQMTQHLIRTKQVPELGIMLLQNNPMLQMIGANLKFFLAWDVLDRVSYTFQQPMIENAANRQVQAELDRYGDLYKPQPGAPANNEPRLDVLERISGNSRNIHAHEGALITLPIFGTMLAMDKLHLVNDELKTILRTNANRANLNLAINEQTATAFEQNMKATLADVVQIREQYEQATQEAAEMKDSFQGICDILNNYEQSLNNVINSNADLGTRAARYQQIVDKYNAILEKETFQLQRQQNELLIQQLQQDKANLKYQGFSPDQTKQAEKVYQKTINELKKAGRKTTLDELLDLQQKALDNAKEQLAAIVAQQPAPAKSLSEMTPKEVRNAIHADWEYAEELLAAYEASFQIYGDQAVAEFRQTLQTGKTEIEGLLKDSRMNAQEQATQYYDLVNQLDMNLATLLNKYASQPNGELDELLPSAY